MEFNNLFYNKKQKQKQKQKQNGKNNEYKLNDDYDPNNSMKNFIISIDTEKEETNKMKVSMVKKSFFEDNSLEKEEEKEVDNDEEEVFFKKEKDSISKEKISKDESDSFSYNSLSIDRSRINDYSRHKINDSFDEKNYFLDISDNFSIIEPEPPLYYDNEESFTKEVDDMIKKYYNIPITDSKLKILMIAEKPSQAKTISKILSYNKYIRHNHQKMNIYTFEGFFKGIKSFFTVTSVKGHIYNNKYVYRYDENYPVDSYNYNIMKVLKNDDFNIPKFLRNIAKGKDILCLWIDCDPEGENICYEVIHNTLPYMNKKKYQQIYRAIFSSLTHIDIRNAFNNLKEYPNCELSMSVDARSTIDYKVGISFSKLLTSNIMDYIDENEINKNEKDVLSYGPCQTPTLWFCVQRKKEIDDFIPQKLYHIYVEIKGEDNQIHKIYMNSQYQNKHYAKNTLDYLKSYSYLEVKKIIERKIIKDSPEGLKTTTMLKMASSQLKISPKEASIFAQDLYMKGYISYPRTGSTKYPPNFDFKKNLEMFKGKYNSYFSEKNDKYFLNNNFRNNTDIQDLIKDFDIRNLDLSKGIEKGGHEPIIPTDYKPNFFNEEKDDLYNLICLHYFASLSPPLKYKTKEYQMNVGDYSFIGKSSKIIEEGFIKFQPYERNKYISEFPSLLEKKKYSILKYEIEEIISEPPDYITESELIDEMEKYNIGTDGSIPSHIHNLSLRGYVKVDRKKRVIPTRLGVALIDVLTKIEPDIIKPENRAKIENFVKDIEKGKKSYNEALENAIKFYKNKFIDCFSKTEELRKEFGKFFKLKNINNKKRYRYRGNEKRNFGRKRGSRRFGINRGINRKYY